MTYKNYWFKSARGPCEASNTADSPTSAAYTQSFAYDVLDRETSGPGGSYTYGDRAHLHGATAIGSAYTASYDASGEMVCRAPLPRTYCRATPRVRQYAWTLACAPGAAAIQRSVPSQGRGKGAIIMDTEPLLITLARALDREHVDYRVFGQPSSGAGAPAKGHAAQTELATIELNRRICFPDGRVLAIAHHGGLLSGDRELRRGLAALNPLSGDTPGDTPPGNMSPGASGWRRRSSPPGHPAPIAEAPLAILHRERTGLLGHRHILIVAGMNGSEGERRFVLRRRHWFGSPANVDVVPLLDHGGPPDGPPELVLLQAEKSGTWRQRLRAKWLAPRELSLPVVLFVLNTLADLDRRAAVAASAGAAGV